jgi:hypothetical protein
LRKWIIAPAIGLALQACATVDQFGSRVGDGNRNSQDALNEETLLNILRASKGQTSNFVGISQIAGGQTEALSTGLPAINIGPHQTQAQQIYSITNSLSSTVNSSYQASPLVTTSFQEGMLFPISFKQVALLVNSHPREIAFHGIIDSFTLKSDIGQATFWNDPTDNSDEATNQLRVSAYCESTLSSSFTWTKEQLFREPTKCQYSKFVYWLRTLNDCGLTAQLFPVTSASKPAAPAAPSPATNTVNSTPSNSTAADASKTPESLGKLCFDDTIKSPLFTTGSPLMNCDNLAQSKKAAQVAFDFRISGFGLINLKRIILRSPLGVIEYMGKAWHNSDNVDMLTGTAKQFSGPLVTIVKGSGPQCYASATFDGQSWCVPKDAEKTAVLIDIIQQLRNLNIQPTDLNSAFTVRIGD